MYYSCHRFLSVSIVLPIPSSADLGSDLVPKITCQVEARAYLTPLASNTLLVPSRLAFLQRSASGTALACGLANACALVYVAA